MKNTLFLTLALVAALLFAIAGTVLLLSGATTAGIVLLVSAVVWVVLGLTIGRRRHNQNS